MKTYRAITWVVDDEGRIVSPGSIARLGDDSFAKVALSVHPEPLVDVEPPSDAEAARQAADAETAKQAAEVEAAQQAAEAKALKQAEEAEAAKQAEEASSNDPARKEPEAKPAKAKGGAGKGSK